LSLGENGFEAGEEFKRLENAWKEQNPEKWEKWQNEAADREARRLEYMERQRRSVPTTAEDWQGLVKCQDKDKPGSFFWLRKEKYATMDQSQNAQVTCFEAIWQPPSPIQRSFMETPTKQSIPIGVEQHAEQESPIRSASRTSLRGSSHAPEGEKSV